VASGTPFLDTWPLTGTIAGGSGYTNGTYYGVPIGGSANGSGMFATVTVAGGAVTAVDHSTQPGNGYKVGDVMSQISAYIGGTGSGFTYTIATMSSPLASFVNAVDSSRWQYVQSKGFTHVNEFGAKADWSSTDAGTTNNFAAIQTALFFAVRNLTGTAQDAGGFQGDIVKCGVGSYMLMHPSNLTMLIVPDGVYLEGVYGTTLKINDGWYQAQHCIALGNPNGHFANFNCGLRHIRLFYKRGINVAAGTFMVYSNSIQDGGGMDHVHILAGQRGGFKYEIGYGGASTVKFHDLSIDIEGPTSAADFNVGTTIVDCRLWSLGSPSGGRNDTTNAVTLSGTGGMYRFDGIHAELYPNGFLIDLRAGNNPMASFKNCTGGCGILFTILGTSQPGSFSFEQCQKNNGASGAILISNGMSGGSPRASDIRPSDGVVGY
jgi:hypothetical protein